MRREKTFTTAGAAFFTTGANDRRIAAASPGSCFRSNDWSSWKAAPDARSLYISVNGNRVYRLDLAQACPALTSIGVHLVTRPRGSGWICRPADLDLKIADDRGFTTPCI